MSTSALRAEQDLTFHRFSDLPAELRLMIWRLCLPHRVVELDDQEYYEHHYGVPPPQCGLGLTTFLNGKPCVIARVCRESRHVALQSRSMISEKDMPGEARWWSHTRIEKLPPIDSSRDIVHLNWQPNEYSHEGCSAHHLAWYATKVARGGSLMVDNLSSRVEAFMALPSWTVVMRVIIIHARPEYAAKRGLFGLLGDELVQIIEVSDEARINAYFDLANESQEKGHAHNPQTLHREPAAAVQRLLKRKTMFRHFLDPVPEFRAAIMFRLCPDMCNHSPDADEEFRPLPEPAPPPRPLWLRRGQGWIRSRTRGRIRTPQEMGYPFRKRRRWGVT